MTNTIPPPVDRHFSKKNVATFSAIFANLLKAQDISVISILLDVLNNSVGNSGINN